MPKPPNASMTNCPIAEPSEKLAPGPAAARARMNTTKATPSLNRLSPSTRIVSRFETPIERKKAITATGSVAEISAPNATAAAQGTPSTKLAINPPTTNAPSNVPMRANTRTGARSRRSRAHEMWRVASNNSGGTRTARIRSALTSI